MGCDGFHPWVPSDLSKETMEEVVSFFEVEQCGRLPQQACTTMFLIVLKKVTSEALHCSSAHSESMVGVAACAGREEVARKVSSWLGCDCWAQWRCGAYCEMERFDCRGSAMDQGEITLVLNLAKALLQFYQHICVYYAITYFEHQRWEKFDGCVAEPLQTITVILFGSKWSCLPLRIVPERRDEGVSRLRS